MQHLVGRRDAFEAAQQRVTAAIEGVGGALVFVGDAGIGKSLLLEAIADEAASLMTVLRARGVEDEIGFSWSGLASLIRPLVASGDVGRLPTTLRRSLEDALMLTDRCAPEAPTDPHAVSVAVLHLLTTIAAQRPVLLLVDDLHWVDPASARALAFLARRVGGEFVAMIATARHESDDRAAPIFALAPPTVDDADEILIAAGVGSAGVRAALVEALGTNPLMLVSAVGELGSDVRRGMRPLPDPLPFPRTVIDVADHRLRALHAETRRALSAIAVLTRPTLRQTQRLLSELGSGMHHLEEAELAGMVTIDDIVQFTHPSLRTAAHRATNAPDRRHLHALAAGGASDAVARAMHLAASAAGPDEDIADAVHDAAERLARRGAIAGAASQFVRASQLTSDVGRETAWRLAAAELYLDLGLIDHAESLIDEAGDRRSATRAHALARLLHLRERDDEACTLLRSTAAELGATEPQDAAGLLIECLAPMVREGRLADVLDVAGELHALQPRLHGASAHRCAAIAGVFAMLAGASAEEAMQAIGAVLEAEGVIAAAPFVAEVIAPAFAYANRDDGLGAMLDSVERTLRDSAAIVPLISVLAAQQLRNFGFRQPLAIEAGEEAIRLADEIGRPKLAMMAAFGLSVAASVAGDAVSYHRAATLLETSNYPHAVAARLVGLGVLHMSAGRFEQALDAWQELIEAHGFGDPLLTFEADYLETLIRVGRADQAAEVLARFDNDGISLRSPATMARVRATLTAADEQAGELFLQSIEAFRSVNNLIGQGRSELAWGERLRRKRRRAEARVHLERAHQLFRSVGVPVLAARAASELEACGAAVDGSLPVHALLTSRELRIAQLVAGGATNREVGLGLFVSERTVETHITSIFRKLQIKNRGELAARAVVDADLRGPERTSARRPAAESAT